MAANSRVNGWTIATSMPASAHSSRRRSSDMISSGARSGANRRAGWGVKVNTAD